MFNLLTTKRNRYNSIISPKNGGNDNEPPILKLAPPDEYDEKEAIVNLINAGYTVEVVDPYAEPFNEKYRVFQNLPVIGKQIVMVDERGEIIGD